MTDYPDLETVTTWHIANNFYPPLPGAAVECGVGLDLSMKYLRENARERIYQEEMQPVLCTREEVM